MKRRLSVILGTIAALVFIGIGGAQATELETTEYYQVEGTSQQHGDPGFVYEYKKPVKQEEKS